jgi:hypothetical protein
MVEGEAHGRNSADAEESIILAVMADPKPDIIFTVLYGDGPVMNPDTGRPEASHPFEVEGGMA